MTPRTLRGRETLRSHLVLGIVLAACVLFVALAVYVDRTYLDPGGRGYAGEANDGCRSHEGVRYVNAQQQIIVCRDGWVVE
jgi:hypothetical protein